MKHNRGTKMARFLQNGIAAWQLLLGALAGLSMLAWPAAVVGQDAPSRVISVLQDYEMAEIGERLPIKHHAWSQELQQRANEFSQVAIVKDDSSGSTCCRVELRESFPWQNRSEYRLLTIGPNYLPPESDAVRLRVKVLNGNFTLSVGSPTVYFGHSDVQSKAVTVSAGEEPHWQTVEFSLHHDLSRNFRRARFGAKSPRIHYARWIQEPLYLFANQGSRGAILIDDVQLVSKGEGRPFASFSAEQIETVGEIADFEDPAQLAQAFTFFQEPIDLTREPHLVRDYWTPHLLRRVEQGRTGKFSLEAEQRSSEEVSFVGLKALGSEEANALLLEVKVENAKAGGEVVLDFVVYVAPTQDRARFPWQDFAPPSNWKKQAGVSFDYYLGQSNMSQVDYGFYHVRRAVPTGKWTSLVLPFADFICAYGQHQCEVMFQQQQPLKGENVIAVGWLPPWRHSRTITHVFVDRAAFVRVPGATSELQSYWQPSAKAAPAPRSSGR